MGEFTLMYDVLKLGVRLPEPHKGKIVAGTPSLLPALIAHRGPPMGEQMTTDLLFSHYRQLSKSPSSFSGTLDLNLRENYIGLAPQ